MTIEDRLEKLERELACAKRRNHWLLAGVGLALGIGLVAWAFGPATVLAQSTQASLREVRANSFVLEDETGKVGAMLAMTKDGPMLSLLDENGQRLVWMDVSKKGPTLNLLAKHGQGGVALSALEGKPLLHVFGYGKGVVGLSALEDGPGLVMGAEGGRSFATLALTKTGPRLSLFEKDKIVWSAP